MVFYYLMYFTVVVMILAWLIIMAIVGVLLIVKGVLWLARSGRKS